METGRQLLDAAESLFREKGYKNVSLEEIAALTGRSRGAVYWYFKNRQGLVRALRERRRVPSQGGQSSSSNGDDVVRRTKEQAAETGRHILDAAESLFLEKGYENVSLEEVAARVGLTRGAVHWHFKNKQGLVLALRDKGQEPFRKLADDLSLSVGAASLEKLGNLIAELLFQLESDPRQQGLFRVMLRLDIVLADQAEDHGSSFHDEVASTLIRIFQAIERDTGLPSAWTPERAATMLSATVLGLIVEWALGRQGFRLSPDGTNLIKLILCSWKQ